MLSTRDPLQNKGHIQTKSEGLEKNIPCKRRPKESRSCNTLPSFLTCVLHNSSLPQFRTYVYVIPFTAGILFPEILLFFFCLILYTFRRVPILLDKFSLVTFSNHSPLLFPNSSSGYILHINDHKLYFKNYFLIFISSVSP